MALSTSPLAGFNLSPQNKSTAERLPQILPRSASASINGGVLTNVPSDLSNRGVIASIQLLSGTNSVPSTSGTSDNLSTAMSQLQTGTFSDFFLTQVNFEYSEKVQISQTFGDNEVVYYMGHQPVLMSISGILFDALGTSWFTQFISLYSGVLRGSQLALNRNLVKLKLPNLHVVGTFSDLSTQQTSAVDTVINFTAKFIVKSVIPVPATNYGFLNYSPSSSTTNILDWSVGRDGLGGASFKSIISSGVTGALQNVPFLDSGLKALSGLAAPELSYFNTLSSFGKGVFSPIFSVLSSVTNIVQTVAGSISALVSQFTAPVNNVLGVINSILNTTTSIVQTVERDFAATVGLVSNTASNIYNTLQVARNTVGVITQVPQSLSQVLQALSNTVTRGPNAYNLFLGGGASFGKQAFLSSGAPYNAVAPYSL